jgi:hypothetical protein
MLKFLNGWGLSLKRDAIHLWKQRCFEAVKKNHADVEEAHTHATNNSNIMRAKVIENNLPVFKRKTQESLLRKIFEIMFDYRCKRKEKHRLSFEVDDKFGWLRERFMF